jgi:PAS domain S-box-containing protein
MTMANPVRKSIAEIDAFREDRIALVMLQDIALRLIAIPEIDYLSEFVQAAGLAMGADMVLVSRIRSPQEPVTAIALYDRTGQATHYEYPLRGTPCEQVFIDHKPFVMGCGLQEAFPSDEDLAAFGLNSYVGMPLFHEGQCFGLVAALFQAKNPPSDPILKVFKHVEDRIASGIRAHDAMEAENLALRRQVEHGRKRLEIALNASGVGVWEYDLTAGATYWDDRMCELYGVSWAGKKVKAEEWLKLIHPDDLETVWKHTLKAVQERKPYQIEFRILRSDGAVRTLRSVGQYVEIEGANAGFIGCDRDITDDMALAVKLKDRTREAEAANLAKTQFLTNASHELRTPLKHILASLEILRATGYDDAQDKWLGVAQTSGEHLLVIINDFLDITRLENRTLEVDRTTFDPQIIAEHAMEICVAEKGDVALALTVDPATPSTLTSDPRRVGQVMINLLSNAIKFGNGKPIELLLGPAQHADMCVRIEVVDQGCGIEPAQQAAIFDRLHQVDGDCNRLHGGNGLGLSICRELATLLGGYIGVESVPGEGSCFFVELPELDADHNDRPG